MKQKLTLLAIVMVVTIMPAMAQQIDRSRLKNPDEATWAIKGNMQSTMSGGTPTYELLNPQGSDGEKGYIRFKREAHYYGNTIEGEQVVFSLQNAKTNRPNNFRGDMIFWSWNDEAGEWQVDVESGSGRSEYESATYVNFMLVLDCSGSMGEGLNDVINSAKFFLKRMHDVSGGKGNVRVGVIAFSTVEYSRNHTVAPIPLTRDNLNYLNNYIDTLYSGGGTALWYSMNTAAERLQNDYDKNIRGKRFAGSSIVAFTDGHDNTSNDKAKGYSSSKDYYNKYFKTTYPKQKVNNMKIMTWIVGKRGEDITSDNIWSTTESQFKAMADEYIPIRNMSELHGKFEDIANSLIERNTVLNLRVAEGISGLVGWTFPEEKIVEQPKPDPIVKTNRSPWFGISLELGGYGGFFGGLNFDMAFSLNKTFAIGGRIGLFYSSYRYTESVSREVPYYDSYWNGYYWQEYVAGYNTYYDYYDYSMSTLGFLIGPEVKLTFPKDNAVIVGFGGGVMADEGVFYLRAGYKTKKSFFVTADMLFGEYVGVGIGAGFSFGGKLRNR